MRLTERVKEIIEMNVVNHAIPLVVPGKDSDVSVYPIYFARLIGANELALPVTDATNIDKQLGRPSPAVMQVVDRMGGYEAYELRGTARYVTDKEDYDRVAEMRNEAPGFPVHAAVLFDVEAVRLCPPP